VPQAHRIDQNQLAHTVAEQLRHILPRPSAERMPDEINALQPKTIKQIVVVQNQI